MNRRDFLRMISMTPLLRFPNLDDLTGSWDTHIMFPTQVAIDYDSVPLNGQWDYAWANAELNGGDGWINLEIQHLPEKDMLWFCVDGGRICVGEMLPEVTVSWWVEPRRAHIVYCEYKPILKVPADGQTHFVAITWENGHPVKAYLDSDAVWFSDVKLDKEIAQSQWGYTW